MESDGAPTLHTAFAADKAVEAPAGSIVACLRLTGCDTVLASTVSQPVPDRPDCTAASTQRCEQSDDHVLLVTAEPVLAANRLTGWALEHGHELEGLSIAQPSLEDIYLELTAATAVEPST